MKLKHKLTLIIWTMLALIGFCCGRPAFAQSNPDTEEAMKLFKDGIEKRRIEAQIKDDFLVTRLITLLEAYEKECYVDSTNAIIYPNDNNITGAGNLPTILYLHQAPTLSGFLEFLKRKKK